MKPARPNAPLPPGADDVRSGENALDWARAQGVTDRVRRGVAVRVARAARGRRRRIAAAAFAALLAAAAWQVQWRLPATATSVPPATAVAIRALPVQRTLPDGSVADVKPGAEIAIDYSPGLRRVVLRRGEAHFDVRPDPQRPFVVVARGIEARAVGTAFAVALDDGAVQVLVTSGRVAVQPAAAPITAGTAPTPADPVAPASTLVTAGERVVVELAVAAPIAVVETVSPDQITAQLAWREPRLEFSAAPLSEVVAMINRHGATRVELADPALGDLRLSGVVRVGNLEALLHLLRLEFGIAAERRENTWVLRR